jgi:hypothetical protein
VIAVNIAAPAATSLRSTTPSLNLLRLATSPSRFTLLIATTGYSWSAEHGCMIVRRKQWKLNIPLPLTRTGQRAGLPHRIEQAQIKAIFHLRCNAPKQKGGAKCSTILRQSRKHHISLASSRRLTRSSLAQARCLLTLRKNLQSRLR